MNSSPGWVSGALTKPTSPEFTVHHEGKQYVGQRAENLANGAVAVAWVEHGIWDVVHWEAR